jgi:hypothetical protein
VTRTGPPAVQVAHHAQTSYLVLRGPLALTTMRTCRASIDALLPSWCVVAETRVSIDLHMKDGRLEAIPPSDGYLQIDGDESAYRLVLPDLTVTTLPSMPHQATGGTPPEARRGGDIAQGGRRPPFAVPAGRWTIHPSGTASSSGRNASRAAATMVGDHHEPHRPLVVDDRPADRLRARLRRRLAHRHADAADEPLLTRRDAEGLDGLPVHVVIDSRVTTA